MVSFFVIAFLGAYSIWVMRKIYKDKRQRKGHCSDCPYKQVGICK